MRARDDEVGVLLDRQAGEPFGDGPVDIAGERDPTPRILQSEVSRNCP